jgi:pyrimidine deaminase RibD-like protein
MLKCDGSLSTDEMEKGDPDWMTLALLVGRRAQGKAYPNPPVGAALVQGGRLLAVGHTQPAGHDHAEVDCIKRAGAQAAGSTLYATLEPCCHVNRTGACTDAILRASVARVVVGIIDPNPRVAGQGVKRLVAAGVRVDVGVCAEQVTRDLAEYLWRAERGLLDGFAAAVREQRDALARRASGGADADWVDSCIHDQSIREQLGDVRGLRILDYGGGDGRVARFLASAGAEVSYFDPSPAMTELARGRLGALASYLAEEELTSERCAGRFDAVVASMLLHGVEDIAAVLAQVRRLLRPRGRVLATFAHPCFEPPRRGWLVDRDGRRVDYGVDLYGNIGVSPPADPRRGLDFHRTLSSYINAFIAAGFRIRAAFEPSGVDAESYPSASLELADDYFRRAPVFGLLAVRDDDAGT